MERFGGLKMGPDIKRVMLSLVLQATSIATSDARNISFFIIDLIVLVVSAFFYFECSARHRVKAHYFRPCQVPLICLHWV